MRPLQTCKKFVLYQPMLAFRLFVGNGLDRSGRFAVAANLPGGVGSPRPTFVIIGYRAVGAGQAPPATIYFNEYNGLACRHGYYAARCSHTDNAAQWVNRTVRNYASPANVPNVRNRPSLRGTIFLPFFGVDFLQICINYNRFVIFDGQPAQIIDTPIGQCVCVVGFFPFLSVKFHLVFYPPPVYYNNCQRGRTSTSAPQKNHCKKKEKQL